MRQNKRVGTTMSDFSGKIDVNAVLRALIARSGS
jgi:hypothetical protein